MRKFLRQLAIDASNRVKNPLLRARLKDRDFTIVSNNCWGSHIYQHLGEPYRTPFVGLYVDPECYVRLVNRIRWYLQQEVTFVDESRHERVNLFRAKQRHRFPIGLIGGDVELQFLHYESQQEAADKWSRRAARVSQDDQRFFYKFCDRDASLEHLAAFDAAPVAHKVCFVADPSVKLQSAVYIPGSRDGQVPDGKKLSRISPRYFDAAAWINRGDGRPHWWRPLRCA